MTLYRSYSADLDDCEVQLLDCTDRIKAQNVRNSKVFVGACSSQVIISHCRDCTFTLATREFYAHDTEVRPSFDLCVAGDRPGMASAKTAFAR